MSQTVSQQFDNPISEESAYRLICLSNNDEGGRDSVSARGWLKYSSWRNDRMYLTDGSYIYRESFVHGELFHSNVTMWDIFAQLGTGLGKTAQMLDSVESPVLMITREGTFYYCPSCGADASNPCGCVDETEY